MIDFFTGRQKRYRQSIRVSLLLASASLAGGCGTLVSNAASGFAENLANAVLNQPDPGVVRDGVPSYLLLLDSLLEGDPENTQILGAAAEMYAAYGAVFVDDPARAKTLTTRSRDYARKALCLTRESTCDWESVDFEAFSERLAEIDSDAVDPLYSYALGSLAWVRAHSDDWNALAELPQMEAMIVRLREIDSGERDAALLTYLGILATLRPAALGGKPEEGKAYFEEALALSDGRDLSIKMEIARSYARPLYLREMHDELLQEVVGADPQSPGYTLTNVIAQEEARELLASADDFF